MNTFLATNLRKFEAGHGYYQPYVYTASTGIESQSAKRGRCYIFVCVAAVHIQTRVGSSVAVIYKRDTHAVTLLTRIYIVYIGIIVRIYDGSFC